MARKEEVLKTSTLKIWVSIALILPLLTYSMAYFFGDAEGLQNLDGSIATRDEVLNSMLKTLYIALPIAAFLIGLLVALIPYKEADYKDKVIRSVLLVLMILEALFFIPTLLGTLAQAAF